MRATNIVDKYYNITYKPKRIITAWWKDGKPQNTPIEVNEGKNIHFQCSPQAWGKEILNKHPETTEIIFEEIGTNNKEVVTRYGN